MVNKTLSTVAMIWNQSQGQDNMSTNVMEYYFVTVKEFLLFLTDQVNLGDVRLRKTNQAQKYNITCSS